MRTSVLLMILATALAPTLWGSSYIVFTQTLPTSHPLLVGAMRALPAGLLLMQLGPGFPPQVSLVKLSILGLANIGLFFGLLFVAASRLPGGIAATVGAVQPLIVGVLAWLLLSRRLHPLQALAAVTGMAGVALLVLDPSARPDLIGILAAFGGAASMALGTVLIERWGNLGTPLALTAWQLCLGGLALLPIALYFEGLPPVPSTLNLIGLGYLVLFGTALAYWLWIRGILRLGADVVFLALLSPLVATILGTVFLGEIFTPIQFAGVVLILVSTVAGIWMGRR